jgi:translation initiation factor IF-3
MDAKLRSLPFKVNHFIRARTVRLVDANGKFRGTISLQSAMQEASKANTDLVQIEPDADVPLCKLISYKLYAHQLRQKQRATKKSLEPKEIRFGANIAEHDTQTKVRHVEQFLDEGRQVRLTVTLKRVDMDLRDELGREILNNIVERLGDRVTPGPIRSAGTSSMHMFVTPMSKKQAAQKQAKTATKDTTTASDTSEKVDRTQVTKTTEADDVRDVDEKPTPKVTQRGPTETLDGKVQQGQPQQSHQQQQKPLQPQQQQPQRPQQSQQQHQQRSQQSQQRPPQRQQQQSFQNKYQPKRREK